MDMELVKENIECEQLLSEKYSDTVVKTEFLIPDTHPDVAKILTIDTKAHILNSEVIKDKVYVEGQAEYNILYLGMEDGTLGVNSVKYINKFSNYIEIKETEYKIICESGCFVEHMECSIVNERKVSIEGIIKLKAELYKNYKFDVVKDIQGSRDIQMLKNHSSVDKIFGNYSNDIVAKSNIKVSIDKPQLGEVLKCDTIIRNSSVRLSSGKINIDGEAVVWVLYRGKEIKDISYLEDVVSFSREYDIEGVNPSMETYSDVLVEAVEFRINEDDLGENRLLDVETLVKANVKVMYKEDIDMLEDAYSPETLMKMDKTECELNVMHAQESCRTVIKGDIELRGEYPKVSKIVMCFGDLMITDKKLVEDKVLAEGVLNVNLICKSFEEEVFSINEELPFNSIIDIPGSKIDMQCIVRGKLENIEAYVEIDHISVKSSALLYARVDYVTRKEFVVDIAVLEAEVQRKKSSITIYVVQQGDTLWKVAKKYGTTIEGIMDVNNIDNEDIIRSGDKLIVPGRALI